MFTGLVEAVGRVHATLGSKAGLRITINAPWSVVKGESIAVNGVCLTVVKDEDRLAGFDVVPETLSRTNLGMLKKGSSVNLERSLRVGDRLGGHFVQGHVDGTGVVASQKGGILRVDVDASLARLMISKGSIAVDGVSLTLVDVERDFFTVALIPSTLRGTTLGKTKKGTKVNLELDLISKYVDKLAGRRKDGVTAALLKRAGFKT